ncbi:hypothetical protein [Spirosoma koreense]
MKEIEEYRRRIQQASTLEEKKAIAAELHRLADTFDESQQQEYQSAMGALKNDLITRLETMDPYIQQAEELVARIKARVPQS